MLEDDKKWISEQIKKLPNPPIRQTALIKYAEVFSIAHDAEPQPHRKDGKARQEANTRLRKYVQAVQDKLLTALK